MAVDVTLVEGRTYLVTGGASLIGSHIADQLLAQGAAEVRLLDNYALGTPAMLAHLEGERRVKKIKGDVLRLPDLLDAMAGVDGVFALAGYLTLPMAQDPLSGVSVNTIGMVNTLEACRFSGVRRIVFSSSISTYGNAAEDPISEETGFVSAGLPPASFLYGATKLVGEALCARYAQVHKVQFNVLRFSSVYGERQHERAVNAVYVAQVCEQVRRNEPPVIVGDGSEVHDYVYVTDVAHACVLAMQSASHGHAMNIATGVDTTHTGIAQLAISISGKEHLKPLYKNDTRVVRSAALTRLGLTRERALREIGWEPKVNVEEGMRRLLNWMSAVR